MLLISDTLQREIKRHAERGYALEVCGFLIGTADGETRRVTRVCPVRNAWETAPELRAAILADGGGEGPSRSDWEAASEERRFLIDPRDFAAVDREAQAAGLQIVGFYHSHPNHPAVPSRFDQEMAIPEQSYVIVSVRDGKAEEFRSWTVPDFGAEFAEEKVGE